MPDQWDASELQYVLFAAGVSGGVSGDPLRVRLCMYTDYNLKWSCGIERTVDTESEFNWVPVPNLMPKFPTGAYVQFKFPEDQVSTVRSLIPVWSD